MDKKQCKRFTHILAKRVAGFAIAGGIAWAVWHFTHHPIAFLAFAERTLDWVASATSDALIETEGG